MTQTEFNSIKLYGIRTNLIALIKHFAYEDVDIRFYGDIIEILSIKDLQPRFRGIEGIIFKRRPYEKLCPNGSGVLTSDNHRIPSF